MITYGFYNSKNHDRLYDARQFGSIFDGIINDGIYMSIGTCFRVIPAENMMVLVGAGRAWFNHTWTLNDAPLPLFLPQSELLLDRIDAIVLDIYVSEQYRRNDVIIIKGTPSKTPQKPTLINNNNRHQYPLAYVSVRANVTSIRAADITSMVGTDETPYVTGIIETVSVDSILDQWQDQWQEFYENQTEEIEDTKDSWNQQWQDYYEEKTGEMENTADYWKVLWAEWFYSYTNQSQNGLNTWIENTEEDIIDWWESIKAMLEEECCANCAAEIVELKKRVSELEEFEDALVNKREIYTVIYDTLYNVIIGELTDHNDVEIETDGGFLIDFVGETSEPILDNEMNPLKGTEKFSLL